MQNLEKKHIFLKNSYVGYMYRTQDAPQQFKGAFHHQGILSCFPYTTQQWIQCCLFEIVELQS